MNVGGPAADSPDEAERRCIAAVARDDRVAFETLYRQYETRVFHYILTLVGDRTVAEELVVDTMLGVWRGARSYGGNSRVSTWILGIARHKAIDRLRSDARGAAKVPLEEAASLAQEGPCAFDELARADSARLLGGPMAALSLEHREALSLAYFQDLSYDQIADLLGLPVNTVKTRVFYARQRLRELMPAAGRAELAP
jgi:RNA polymerase sigma-70 factor (ECF subfamily)